MTPRELASALSAALAAGEVVECELGVFFVVVWPASVGRNPRTGGSVAVPPKHIPTFAPSDALLARVGGERALTSLDYRVDMARDLMGTVDLASGTAVVCDPDDEHASITVPMPTTRIEVGALLDEIASAVLAKKKLAIAGLGTFKRITVRRGPRRGAIGVAFEPSSTLKVALAGR